MSEESGQRRRELSSQFVLDLGFRTALNRDDFIVAPCNAGAVAAIDRWPDWRGGMMALCGPPGSGKTHLAEVWRSASGARCIEGHALKADDLPGLMSVRALVVENGENLRDENALFHLFNMATEEKVCLLLTGQRAPARWNVKLADLASRLSVIPVYTLAPPDDETLRAVLEKLFRDRQLSLTAKLADYLLMRMERSFAVARDVTAALDRASMAQKRKLTVALAREVLVAPE